MNVLSRPTISFSKAGDGIDKIPFFDSILSDELQDFERLFQYLDGKCQDHSLYDHSSSHHVSPIALYFLHRYLINCLDSSVSVSGAEVPVEEFRRFDISCLDTNSLEVPLKLISKDVNLLVATYNSLRLAYSTLQAKYEEQQIVISSKLSNIEQPLEQYQKVYDGTCGQSTAQNISDTDHYSSLQEWECAIEQLQEEWKKLQIAIEQASWSLYVLSNRQTLYHPSALTDQMHHTDQLLDQSRLKNQNLQASLDSYNPNCSAHDTQLTDLGNNKKLLYELECKEKELCELKEKAFRLEDSLSRAYHRDKLLEEQTQTISSLENKISQLESELFQSHINEQICSDQRRTIELLETEVSELQMGMERLTADRDSFIPPSTNHQVQMESELEAYKFQLAAEYEAIKNSLIVEYQGKEQELEQRLAHQDLDRISMQNEIDRLNQSLSSLNYQLQEQQKQSFKEEDQSKLSNNASQGHPPLLAPIDHTRQLEEAELEMQKSELRALSLHLNDLQQQLICRQEELDAQAQVDREQLTKQHQVFAEMERQLLIRTKEEAHASMEISRQRKELAEQRVVLEKEIFAFNEQRNSLDEEKEALTSLTSLLEERKRAIESSLLAQSEAIESERSRLLAEKALFEKQKREATSDEKITLLQLALTQLEQEKLALGSKSLKDYVPDNGTIRRSTSLSPNQRIILSPIRKKNSLRTSKKLLLTSPSGPFYSPNVTYGKRTGLSTSFRRLLTKIASASESPLIEDRVVNDYAFKNGEEPKNRSVETTTLMENNYESQYNDDVELRHVVEDGENSEISALSYVEIAQRGQDTANKSPDISRIETESSSWHTRGDRWNRCKVSLICSYLRREHQRAETLAVSLQKAEELRIAAVEQLESVQHEHGDMIKIQNELAAANVELGALKDKLNSQYEENQRLRLAQDTASNEYRKICLILEQKQTEIDIRGAEVTALHEEISSLNMTLTSLKDQITSLNECIGNQRIQIESLETAIDAIHTEGSDAATLRSELSMAREELEAFQEEHSTDRIFTSCLKILDDTRSLKNDLSLEKTLSPLLRESISELEFVFGPVEQLLVEEDSWMQNIEQRLAAGVDNTTDAVDIFVIAIDAKISTLIRHFLDTNIKGEDLAVVLARTFRRLSHAVFLFTAGLFRELHHSSSRTMTRERIRTLELALEVAEKQRQTHMKERAQHLSRIAALAAEVEQARQNKSASYWKERCRVELEHRTDLIFQKKYLVLEVTSLRSNEMMLISLLDQLGDAIPVGILSPTPGLASPTRPVTHLSSPRTKFVTVGRSVLAVVRFIVLLRRRNRLMAAASLR